MKVSQKKRRPQASRTRKSSQPKPPGKGKRMLGMTPTEQARRNAEKIVAYRTPTTLLRIRGRRDTVLDLRIARLEAMLGRQIRVEATAPAPPNQKSDGTKRSTPRATPKTKRAKARKTSGARTKSSTPASRKRTATRPPRNARKTRAQAKPSAAQPTQPTRRQPAKPATSTPAQLPSAATSQLEPSTNKRTILIHELPDHLKSSAFEIVPTPETTGTAKPDDTLEELMPSWEALLKEAGDHPADAEDFPDWAGFDLPPLDFVEDPFENTTDSKPTPAESSPTDEVQPTDAPGDSPANLMEVTPHESPAVHQELPPQPSTEASAPAPEPRVEATPMFNEQPGAREGQPWESSTDDTTWRTAADRTGKPSNEETASGQKTVLVIDDDKTMRRLLELGFRRNDYECLLAENGLEAQAVLQRHRPDVILLDLMMPVMDGLTFLHWLRQTLQDSTPVLVFTNVSTPKVTQEALAAGANAFACKPLHLKELVRLANELVPKAKTAPPTNVEHAH